MSDYNTANMTDMQAGVLRQAALERIANARKAAPDARAVEHVEVTVGRFYDDLGALEQAEVKIGGDPNLSPEGKRDQRARLLERWERESAEQLAELVEDVARATRVDEAKIKPRPPIDDPVALEAKLGNARADATMMLGGTEPTNLPDRMRQLVEHDADPAVSYLLVATPWSTNYLRSRLPADRGESAGPLVQWSHVREHLTRGLLDEAGQRAFDRANALRPLRQVPTIVQHTRDYALKTRRNR